MAHIVWEIRMFELGHSLKQIRKMSLADFGNIIGYWSEKGRAEEKNAKRRKNLKGN